MSYCYSSAGFDDNGGHFWIREESKESFVTYKVYTYKTWLYLETKETDSGKRIDIIEFPSFDLHIPTGIEFKTFGPYQIATQRLKEGTFFMLRLPDGRILVDTGFYDDGEDSCGYRYDCLKAMLESGFINIAGRLLSATTEQINNLLKAVKEEQHSF